jgi:hypothetical protein
MYRISLLVVAALLSFAEAKICTNFTIPVEVSSRAAIFGNVPPPVDLAAVTRFALDFTRQGSNYTDEAVTGYATISETFNISAKFCRPNNSPARTEIPVVQFLTHGIGFDKT